MWDVWEAVKSRLHWLKIDWLLVNHFISFHSIQIAKVSWCSFLNMNVCFFQLHPLIQASHMGEYIDFIRLVWLWVHHIWALGCSDKTSRLMTLRSLQTCDSLSLQLHSPPAGTPEHWSCFSCSLGPDVDSENKAVYLPGSCATSPLLWYVTSIFCLFCRPTSYVSLFLTRKSSDETIEWLTAADLKFWVDNNFWVCTSLCEPTASSG